nr:hypothetical protein [Tanacetum cinerariifolium]
QADWKDDTDNKELEAELEAHYMYMAKIQEVSPDAVDSGPIFDTEPEQKVQNNDHYDVFAIECQHHEQSGSVHKTYLIKQDVHNVLIKSEDMNYDSEQIDQNEEDADLAKELEKLKSKLEDFRIKNKSLKEANNKLSKEKDLLYADFKKSKAELKRRDSIEYATEMELECAKVKAEFYTYKKESQMSCVKNTQTINDLNQAISEMKNKLSAHQDTILISVKLYIFKTLKYGLN